MLSGIQLFLEKNRKWLFGFLLIVIIIPFVFTIGSMPGLGYGKKKHAFKLFGHDLNDPKQVEAIVRDGALSIALQTGSEENVWMESAQGYAFHRLVLLSVVHALRLPAPSDDQLNKFIKTRPLFWDENQTFQPKLYNAYLNKWSKRFGKTQSLRQLLVEDCLCERVKSILSESNFVLPKECETLFKQRNASYQLDYVSVKNDVALPSELAEDELKSFFEENKGDYRVDRKVKVALLFFDAKKHRSDLPIVSDQILKHYFEAHAKDFSTESEVSFESVKPEVQKRCEAEQLRGMAENCATQFVMAVYDKNIRWQSPEWEQLLAENNVRIIDTLPAYEKDALPSKKGLKKEILLSAFDLDKEHFLSDPMSVKNGYVVLALKECFDPYYPNLDDVRERVVKDCKVHIQNEIFNKKVSNLQEQLNQSSENSDKLLADHQLVRCSMEPFSLNLAVKDLLPLLPPQEIFKFIKELETLPEGQWSSSFEGKNKEKLLFFCKSRSFSNSVKQEELQEFEKSFKRMKNTIYSESLWREILENVMRQVKTD